MPTNNIKHFMLTEAKKIANTKYIGKTETHRGLDGSISGETYYPPTYFMNLDIEEILENHPEFDEDTFRGMIRTFQKKDNSDDSPTI